MNFFEEATLRLKQQLKVTEDKQVAEALGLTSQALVMRKKRGKFPETELYALVAKRPDLKIDVDYVLTGQRRGEVTGTARLRLDALSAHAGWADGSDEGKALVARLVTAEIERVQALRAERKADYDALLAMLDGCTNESFQMVLRQTELMRAGEAHIALQAAKRQEPARPAAPAPGETQPAQPRQPGGMNVQANGGGA